jgi:3-oxoacyl-[acyl-carrier protein] reductase
MNLQGKIALVTGASRGIGKDIACQLAKAKAKVVGTATTEQGAENITKFLQEYGVDNKGLVLNIADNSSIENLLAMMADFSGMPTILVNNAGVTEDNLLLRLKQEQWSRVIDTNLSGVYSLIKPCLRSMMKARWGRIINISSVIAFTGNSGQANYAAAKSGMIGLSKSIAQEVASRGITVNVVAPGFIDTDMTKVLSEEQHTKIIEQIPIGKMGQASDVANVVAFLASDLAGYITGETIHVNGGMLMH